MIRVFILIMSIMAISLVGCSGEGSGSPDPGRVLEPAPEPEPPSEPLPIPQPNPNPDTAGNNWTNAKFGGGGYVPGLVFHPVTPDVLYARTDIGGAYRWDEDASSWLPITDSFGVIEATYMGGESIALDPTDDYRVYLSTGQYINSGNGRLYISSDRGDSWAHVVELPFPVGSNNSGRAIGERMMVDPNLPSTLFYGSRTAGLWKSTDSGLTWSQVTSLSSTVMTPAQISAVSPRSPAGVQFVLFDTDTMGTGSATQTIYVGVGPDYSSVAGLTHKIYRSTDGGTTWEGLATPVDSETDAEGDPREYYIPKTVRADDGLIYMAFTGGIGPGAPGPARLFRFDGADWTLLSSEDPPDQWTNHGYGGLSVWGSGSSTRIALGVTNSWGDWAGKPVLQFSDDAGVTWREISGTPHREQAVTGWIDDVEINPFNPDHVLHVHGGGVWETFNASDENPTWIEKVDGIEETVPLHLVAPPPGAPYVLLNASGDIGTSVHTSLDTKPTRTPGGNLLMANGASVDMAWTDASYIVTVGTKHWGIDSGAPTGLYSKDAGVTWASFGSLPEGAGQGLPDANNIAVTSPDNLVWSVANYRPSYSTDNGTTWHETNLPDLSGFSVNRSYHVAADRQNPNKVYAYDHGGHWWGTPGRFYYSTDGGKTFTQSTDPNLTPRASGYEMTSLAVNPFAEGDVWLVDGHSVFHSLDSGVTWRELTVTESVWGTNETWSYPEIYGASNIALGIPAAGSDYSAAVYLVGVIDDVWGLYRSDDMGSTWERINDDTRQFGGIFQLAADNNVYGRVYLSGVGRGVIYNE